MLLIVSFFWGRYEGLVLLSFILSSTCLLLSKKNTNLTSTGIVGVLFCLFLLIYLLPIPSFLLPERNEYHETAFETSRRIQEIQQEERSISTPSQGPSFVPITLNRSGSLRFLMFSVSIVAIFISYGCLKERVRGEGNVPLFSPIFLFTYLLLSASTCCGLISLFLVPQGKLILWLFPVLYGNPIGPFVNPNHFAYSNLLLIGASIFVLTQRHFQPNKFNQPLRYLISASLTKAVPLFFILLAITSIATSSSRSALIALLGGLLSSSLFILFKRSIKGFAYLAIILIAAVWLALFVSYSDKFEFNDKLQSLKDPLVTDSAQTRIESWINSAQILKSFPMFGTGPESFRSVYPLFQTVNNRKHLVYAENEYVQTIIEFGIVGILFIGVLSIFPFVSNWRRRRFESLAPNERGIPSNLSLVFLVSVTLFHCMFDFPLRHPFNALSFLFLLLVTRNWNSDGDRKIHHHLNHIPLVLVTLTSLAFLASLISTWSKDYSNDKPSHTVLNKIVYPIALDKYDQLEGKPISTLLDCLTSAPTSPAVWKQLGLRLIEYSNHQDTDFINAAEAAEAAVYCIEKSCEYNPSNYRNWLLLAETQHLLGYTKNAKESFSKAKELRPYLRAPFPK